MHKAHIIGALLVVSLIALGACTPAPKPESPLPAPKLLSPNNGATDIQFSPILLWEPVPEAKVYELRIARNSDFSDVALDVSPINASYELSVDLEPATRYYWMACAKMDLVDPDAPVACSEVWTFTTAEQAEPEPEPTPVKPSPIPQPEPSTEPIPITAALLSTEYNNIGLAADTAYKNQVLVVSGTFDYFNDDEKNPHIFFETGPGYFKTDPNVGPETTSAWGLRAYLADEQEAAKAKTLTKGDEIVVLCTCKGSTILNIILSGCRFVVPQ